MLDTSVGVLGVDEAYEIAAAMNPLPTSWYAVWPWTFRQIRGSSLSSSSSATDSRARRARIDDGGLRVPSFGASPENARVVAQQQDGVSRDFLQRLSDLMVQFKSVEGRKTVVFFSEGFHAAERVP